MKNERLRDALLRGGFTPESAGEALAVDPKTIERWITKGRTPYPRHRYAVAALLRESETFLWPNAIGSERAQAVSTSEVAQVYPRRHDVPSEVWRRLITDATSDIAIVVYAGLFLTEDPALVKALKSKARSGCRIRLLFGDADSDAIQRRSAEERIGVDTIAVKIRNALHFFRPLADESGAEIRLHGTTLYNSIYRFDDEMLVNTHVYGSIAAHAPVLHLRRLSGGELFNTYADSFNAIWQESKPARWPN